LDKAISAIRDIEGSSGKISQISSVLEDIAFQTNLLALNAGVEAARAGDAGKGFAVVASEVRSLAGRAAESAKEINELIQTSRKQVSEGTVQVESTAGSLSELLAQVEELGGLVGEIAGSIKHQAKGQAEISTGVEQLDTMTQQNAAIGEEANAAGHTLQAEAKRLMIALQGFKGIGTRPGGRQARNAA
jgi:methyl-accepting chemotaxis protein